MNKNKKNLLLNSFIIGYIGIFIFLYVANVKHFNGAFIYGADDPYIHLQIVHNVVENGYWGMSEGEIATASSSILWTGLLAVVFIIFGEHTIIPLIINFLFGILILIVVYKFINRLKFPFLYQIFTLFIVLGMSNIFLIAFVGMEHLMHAYLALLFLYYAYKTLMENHSCKPLYLIAPFMVATRYESAFLVLIVCFYLFFMKKKYKESILLGLISLIIITAAGLYFEKNGANFLPNTILVKGNAPHIETVYDFLKYVTVGLYYLLKNNIVLLSMLVVYKLLKPSKNGVTEVKTLVVIYFFHAYLYHQFMEHGGEYFRYTLFYDTYKALLIMCFFPYLYQRFIDRYTVKEIATKMINGMIIIITLMNLYIQTIYIKKDADEIYLQHKQITQFIQTYHNDDNVAANDIGMVTYFTHIKLLDLWGLASQEVTEAKRNKQYNSQYMDEMVKKKKIDLIFVYDDWFESYGGIPSNWYKVAEWEFENANVTGEKVSFYVIEKEEKEQIVKEMNEFKQRLPKEVKVTIFND